jgi:hypothetical protein
MRVFGALVLAQPAIKTASASHTAARFVLYMDGTLG